MAVKAEAKASVWGIEWQLQMGRMGKKGVRCKIVVLDDAKVCLCRFTFSYGTRHSLLLAEYWKLALLMTIGFLCVFSNSMYHTY